MPKTKGRAFEVPGADDVPSSCIQGISQKVKWVYRGIPIFIDEKSFISPVVLHSMAILGTEESPT